MATSVSRVYLTGCNYELAYDLLGQNSANNTSTVRLYGILHVTNNQISWTRGTASVHTESGSIGTYYAKGDHVVIQRDFTWSHDGNGNFSAYIGASLSTTFVSGDTGGTITLPHINRQANLTSTMNFNDEQNVTIKFSNPAGYRINARLEFGGTSIRRDNIPNTGTYTFELTSTERDLLRSKTPNSNTLGVRETLATCYSGTTESAYSYEDKTMTIVNANPTFTYTNTEINSKVSALLGTTASTVVQNASKVRFVVSPTALKSATISKVQVIHNGKTYTDTSSPYQIDVPVTANSFTIKVTDSRNNSTQQTITKTMIAYKNVDITSLTIKRQNQTSSNIRINLEAVYYQKTFGSTANVPIVKWKLDNGSYTTIPSSSYTIANNKLTISNYTLSNVLPYTSAGTFTIQISDKISSDTDSRNVTKGVATFDAGEHDFQVNGDLYIADINRENAWNVADLKGITLYETNNPSTGNTLTLTDNISNYKRIVIYAWDSELNNHYTTEVYNNGSSTIDFVMKNAQANYGSGSYTVHQTFTNVSISDKTLTKGYRTYVNVSQNAVQSQTSTGGTSNSSRIEKIVGYKN